MEGKGIRTVCGFCHCGCGMIVYPGEKGGGKVTGDPEHPVNRGALCPKGRAVPEFLAAADRLTAPLLKTPSGFRTVSWDEALAFMAEKLERLNKEYGPQNLVRFRGAPMSDTIRDAFSQFLAVYGSNNTSGISHLCSSPERMAYQSIFGSRPDPDYEATKLVLVWASNPEETHQYGDGDASYQGFNPLRKCKQQGARIIAIDPRRSETVKQAHDWIPIRVGSDMALALAMAKVIIDDSLYDAEFVREYTVGFEAFRDHLEPCTLDWAQDKTGLAANQIRDLAHDYASTKPAAILQGNGLNMHPNVVQTTRAIASLMILTGNLDVPGGNAFFPKVPQAPCPSVTPAAPIFGKKEYPLYPPTPFPNVIDALAASDPDRPRSLIVYHANPAVVNAREEKVQKALAALDFLVVVDLFMTKTAQMADLVLPDTSIFETWGYAVYFSKQGAFVALSRPVREPVGLSRPALEVELELAARMGLAESFPWKSTAEWFDYKLKPAGITFEKLQQEQLIYVTPPASYKKCQGKKFATPSGKIEFFSEKFQKFGYSPLPVYQESAVSLTADYPLFGTTRKPGAYVHTQFRNLPSLRKLEPDARLRIHPQDAAPRQIREGDRVRVASDFGSIHLKAAVTDEIQAGLIVIDYGWGNPGDGGDNVNRLTGDFPRDSLSSTTPNREFSCQVWQAESNL